MVAVGSVGVVVWWRGACLWAHLLTFRRAGLGKSSSAFLPFLTLSLASPALSSGVIVCVSFITCSTKKFHYSLFEFIV